MSFILVPPLSKRQDEWVTSITEGLVELQNTVEGFKLDNLSENDSFVTTVMQATQTALRTHKKEKIDALRNAVLNSCLLNAPEDDIQMIFLYYIDELTPWHLRIMNLFDDDLRWAEEH